MRLYSFTNYYLSSIQGGIQTAHVVHELFLKYPDHGQVERLAADDMLGLWASNHKTIVVLNGGNSADLEAIAMLFDEDHNPYPWESFCEDEASLNQASTCVGIVVPDLIYETAELVRKGSNLSLSDYAAMPMLSELTAFDWSLITLMNKCPLAR